MKCALTAEITSQIDNVKNVEICTAKFVFLKKDCARIAMDEPKKKSKKRQGKFMDIEKFRIKPTSLDLYYPLFLVNNLKRELYVITLVDGDREYEGVPTAVQEFHGASVKPYFHFRIGENLYAISFSVLVSAKLASSSNQTKFEAILTTRPPENS